MFAFEESENETPATPSLNSARTINNQYAINFNIFDTTCRYDIQSNEKITMFPRIPQAMNSMHEKHSSVSLISFWLLWLEHEENHVTKWIGKNDIESNTSQEKEIEMCSRGTMASLQIFWKTC